MQRRLKEISLDGGYYLAEQRSAVKARSLLSGAALSCLCARSLYSCTGQE